MSGRQTMGGDRGGGWVALQFLVMAGVVGAGFLPPRWPDGAHAILSVVGAVIAVCGAMVAVWATRLLGRGFTPYPRPVESSQLVERGPYRLVRHPIYAGGLAFFTGYGLFAGVVALVSTLALGVVWGLKARVEEGYLRGRYPGYAGYASRVRFRLVPFVY